MSPRAAAPSKASVTACSSTSASLCPTAWRRSGTSMPAQPQRAAGLQAVGVVSNSNANGQRRHSCTKTVYETRLGRGNCSQIPATSQREPCGPVLVLPLLLGPFHRVPLASPVLSQVSSLSFTSSANSKDACQDTSAFVASLDVLSPSALRTDEARGTRWRHAAVDPKATCHFRQPIRP